MPHVDFVLFSFENPSKPSRLKGLRSAFYSQTRWRILCALAVGSDMNSALMAVMTGSRAGRRAVGVALPELPCSDLSGYPPFILADVGVWKVMLSVTSNEV